MQFANPLFFLLLIPLFICAGFYLYSGARRYMSGKVSVAIKPSYTLRVLLHKFLPPFVRIAAAVLLIIAFARPQKVEREIIPPTEGIDIMMVMDTSPSMGAMDFRPVNRMEAAKAAAKEFISKRRNDRIGITVFAGAAFLSCPLTLDYGALNDSMDMVRIDMTGIGMTAIGDAIITAVNHLKNSKAKSRIMILLTDGRSNYGIVTNLEQAAKAAQAYGIKIYTIGTAKKGRAQIPTGNPLQPVVYTDDDLDETSLKLISEVTGGKFYRAENTAELSRIYSEIDSLEKTKFEEKTSVRASDYYIYFLVPAVLLMILGLLLEKTYLRTIP